MISGNLKFILFIFIFLTGCCDWYLFEELRNHGITGMVFLWLTIIVLNSWEMIKIIFQLIF